MNHELVSFIARNRSSKLLQRPIGGRVARDIEMKESSRTDFHDEARVHRMTELFGPLALGATLEQARAELRTLYGSMVAQHPEAYPKQAESQISATDLRDQITSGARTILLVLLAASGLVFVIAVPIAANLILARSLRRESELTVRAALGASTWMLRRTLLAESVLLYGAGALWTSVSAQPPRRLQFSTRFAF